MTVIDSEVSSENLSIELEVNHHMTRAVKIKTSSNLFLMFSSLCIVQLVFITQISLPAVTACFVTQSFTQLCRVLFLTLMRNKKDLIMLQRLAWPEERML